ncbi:MAG: c-type cytochrome biogenesis protein CcmI [Pseudomonadota bacterium]
MNTIWLLFVGLIVVAMLFVLLPVWRYRGQTSESSLAIRKRKNREVFEQREAELAVELQQNVIATDEHERLLAELQRAFLRDMEALELQGKKSSALTGGKAALMVLVLLIPVISLWQYRTWGSADDLGLPTLISELGNATDEAAQNEKLNTLADTLQRRYDRRPEDMQNGYMLGTLYIELERFPEAEATFRKMLEDMEPNADRATVLGQLAQAQYLLHDSMISPEVQATIDEALALDANEYAVMSILAIDAFLKEDVATALGYWRRQLSAATPGSKDAEVLRQRIAMVESYLPKDEAAAAAAASGQITLTIDIAPELAAKVDDSMRLFVFVRNPAMPMPILAQNVDVPEFPFTITLDNSMSMTGMTVESAPELVAGARISTSGNAIAASGDLQTLSAPFVLAEQTAPLELVINEVVP